MKHVINVKGVNVDHFGPFLKSTTLPGVSLTWREGKTPSVNTPEQLLEIVDQLTTDNNVSTTNRPLFGIHSPAWDQGNMTIDPRDWHVFDVTKAESIKLFTGTNVETVQQSLHRYSFVPMRVYFSWIGKPVMSPREAAEHVYNATINDILRAAQLGIRYFEGLNEPNLAFEGLGIGWRDGREFNEFFTYFQSLIKNKVYNDIGAEIYVGYPGLSPGFGFNHGTYNARQESRSFLEESISAAREADFVCCHAYWRGKPGEDDTVPPSVGWYNYKYFLDLFEEVHITECSDSSPNKSLAQKGDEYLEWYHELPTEVRSVYWFVCSSGPYNSFPHENLRNWGEDPNELAYSLRSHI